MKSFTSKSGNTLTIVIKLTVTYGEIMLIRYVVGRQNNGPADCNA
jgi:hypothetical protein